MDLSIAIEDNRTFNLCWY